MLKMVIGELGRLKNTCVWSWRGWRAAWASEKSLRQWTLVNLLSIALASYVDLSPGERALIVALGMLILAAELANTAIEVAVNYISSDLHPLAGKAKDCGSAFVAMTALAGGVAWVILLIG